MASVAIRGVRKAFGPVQVIHGVNVEIADGEFVVLVGPSGCGKSTLLRMIAGLEHISGGEIHISERVVNALAPKERDTAMVFQNYALYPHMTVAANMGFSMKLRGAPRTEIAERVSKAADILGLKPFLDRYPRQLSGGQRQRVAMGRAIVRDPKVFLFDEPLSNLDAKLRVQMRTEIKALHQRLRTTTVYVTHDQIEAMTMADKIVVMHDGRVEQIGAPLDLYDRPGNLFVAGFIGSPAMNFFPGAVRVNGSAVFETPGGVHLPVKVPSGRLSAWSGLPAVYGVRPEHFTLASDGVEAEVQVVEPTGSETQVVVKMGGHEVLAVFRERHQFRPGDRLRLKPDVSLVHLFDQASGNRLS
jgi:multiple sugar transport system ATP-binding protein